jgi:hypothetical protein
MQFASWQGRRTHWDLLGQPLAREPDAGSHETYVGQSFTIPITCTLTVSRARLERCPGQYSLFCRWESRKNYLEPLFPDPLLRNEPESLTTSTAEHAMDAASVLAEFDRLTQCGVVSYDEQQKMIKVVDGHLEVRIMFHPTRLTLSPKPRTKIWF